MHSAGIAAIGALMDHLMPRATQHAAPAQFFGRTLQAMAPHCAWTCGRWPDMDRAWNQVESTAKDIRNLSDQLIRLSQSSHLRQSSEEHTSELQSLMRISYADFRSKTKTYTKPHITS